MPKTNYHLLPVEETRPSIDTISDDSSHHNGSNSEFTILHFTFYLRFVTFSLYLTAVILLRMGGDEAIPSMVFLSLAITHNFYIIARHLITRYLVVRIRLISSSKPNKHMARFLTVLPYVVDGVLLLCLFITLPIGHAHSRSSSYWSNHDDLTGYIVSFVALPFHTLGAFDGGKPSSVALYFKLRAKGDEDNVERHRVSAQDDEEAQHDTEISVRTRGDRDDVLV